MNFFLSVYYFGTAPSPCQQNPCGDHGDCDVTFSNNYTCACRDFYTGDTCSIPPNFCDNGVCLNGGRCVSQVNGYRCECSSNYKGRYCDIAKGDKIFNKFITLNERYNI